MPTTTSTRVVGLLSGIAGGKSTVAALLAEQGATVIDADALAHEALADADVRSAVRRAFGDAVCGPDGAIERSALAARVFGASPEARAARQALEGLVHPWVRARIDAELARARSAGVPLVVLDVPLLLGGPYESVCDALVYVDTPEATRATRAEAARGWDADALARREAQQLPLCDKRRRATFVLDNAGTPQALRAQVRVLADRLRDVPAADSSQPGASTESAASG